MSEKPSIDIKRFLPRKINSKYWLKFLVYLLILGALVVWYNQKSKNNGQKEKMLNPTELDLKGFKIEE